jgi:hypothetical protein
MLSIEMLIATLHEMKIIENLPLLFKQHSCIFFTMNTTNASKPRHKTGPKPMAADITKASFVLPTELWQWTVEQAEGASTLLRKLLMAERQRRERTAAR